MRLSQTILYICLVTIAGASSFGLKPTETRPSTESYPGPLALKWGKTPPDARSVLTGKVEFVSEKPAAEDHYHTIDQHYKGNFGKMPTSDIFLRFYNGEFFYLAVSLTPILAASQPPVAIPLSSVWQTVVDKMQGAYGPAFKSAPAPHLASSKAVAVPGSTEQSAISPLLWNERTQKSQLALYQLRDLQIRTNFWDPFAVWKFSNGVTIQTFIFKTQAAGQTAPTWTPVWLFVKDDLYRSWRTTVHTAQIIEPRDF
jgi:hypothetical protein